MNRTTLTLLLRKYSMPILATVTTTTAATLLTLSSPEDDEDDQWMLEMLGMRKWLRVVQAESDQFRNGSSRSGSFGCIGGGSVLAFGSNLFGIACPPSQSSTTTTTTNKNGDVNTTIKTPLRHVSLGQYHAGTSYHLSFQPYHTIPSSIF